MCDLAHYARTPTAWRHGGSLDIQAIGCVAPSSNSSSSEPAPQIRLGCDRRGSTLPGPAFRMEGSNFWAASGWRRSGAALALSFGRPQTWWSHMQTLSAGVLRQAACSSSILRRAPTRSSHGRSCSRVGIAGWISVLAADLEVVWTGRPYIDFRLRGGFDTYQGRDPLHATESEEFGCRCPSAIVHPLSAGSS